MSETEALNAVEVLPYDPMWPALFAAERIELLKLGGAQIVELEHIGSTGVPGLRAKPIIDIMAAVPTLAEGEALVARLGRRGYRLIETGMTDRLFLRRRSQPDGQVFHLHIVTQSAWRHRHERLMRDHLTRNPEVAQAYAELKDRLAAAYAHDSIAYTRAKTGFVQGVIDEARAELGLPAIGVWND